MGKNQERKTHRRSQFSRTKMGFCFVLRLPKTETNFWSHQSALRDRRTTPQVLLVLEGNPIIEDVWCLEGKPVKTSLKFTAVPRIAHVDRETGRQNIDQRIDVHMSVNRWIHR